MNTPKRRGLEKRPPMHSPARPVMSGNGRLSNYIGGEWREPGTSAHVDVVKPAAPEVLRQVPLSAAGAFPNWRRTPPVDRIKYLFSLRDLLLEHYEELARTITMESGKILDESRGERVGGGRAG